MELVKIENQNGKLVVSSRIIAEQLGKRHDNVVRDLEKILETSNVSSLIIPGTYTVEGQKRQYKEYLLTKDGFTLYMFNIQGHNDFKLAYINKFNEMERALQNQFKVPQTFKEALQLALEQQERIEVLELKQIKDKSKVDFYNDVTESKDTVDMGTVAKVLNIKGIGRNKLFEILRDKKILMADNSPYQKYVDAGWFRQVETKFILPNGDIKINIKTVVFQKGLDNIRKILKAIL